ncbi:hypothetical protein [Luteibacter aegosomatissinici]|uniref:hypothetical protein n=1 Tax=Luteibacter aegosomatissinici TaxID=2911539 RepID=UPI001FFA7C98|nr:hypothetical protein [Luteibacter aegosomatissinici]UPG92830.1 hypothetical protein L2Y97_13240 [Luteibacter aegosomatissinici]
MSMPDLGALINAVQAEGNCLARETWSSVLVSGLDEDIARSMAGLATIAGCRFAIVDSADNDLDVGEIDAFGGPYRISIAKDDTADVGWILTVRAIEPLLLETSDRSVVRIAGLSAPVVAHGLTLLPWEDAVSAAIHPTPSGVLKSPRSFVREYGDRRLAPASIAPWVLSTPIWLEDAIFPRWAAVATSQCLTALGNEVDQGSSAVVFKGPPRGLLTVPTGIVDERFFLAVQACAAWVYETPTETEMRHPLMSAEIARFSSVDGTIAASSDTFARSLDGARLAYDLGMSKLSSDTLKMLTDLRKSVLDESTKVADSTRQLVASVATTLSVGVGLVAAKVGTRADGRIIGAIAVIASAYVAAIVWSGFRSIRLQDAIRLQWKPRTYGFISSDSYASLVDTPARDAAAAYGSIARISLLLTALMLLVVVWSIASFPGEP